MTESESRATAFVIVICFILIVAFIAAIVDSNTENKNVRNLQNHGTKNITTPVYYVDPRTEKCFAMFVNGSTASVECDDLVKSLMANDWINEED